MNAQQFFSLARRMREAQKGFYSTQKGTPEHGRYFGESKKLEAEMDAEIARVVGIIGDEGCK
jgi:hypothetical protein